MEALFGWLMLSFIFLFFFAVIAAFARAVGWRDGPTVVVTNHNTSGGPGGVSGQDTAMAEMTRLLREQTEAQSRTTHQAMWLLHQAQQQQQRGLAAPVVEYDKGGRPYIIIEGRQFYLGEPVAEQRGLPAPTAIPLLTDGRKALQNLLDDDE